MVCSTGVTLIVLCSCACIIAGEARPSAARTDLRTALRWPARMDISAVGTEQTHVY